MGNCQNGDPTIDISVPSGYQGILLTYNTWKGTYSNLFDYTSPNKETYAQGFLKWPFAIGSSSVFISKNGEGINWKDSENCDAVARLEQNEEKLFTISPAENLSRLTSHQLWLVIKSTPSQKYQLKEGDLLRIGKQKIKVKEIVIDDNDFEDGNTEVSAKCKIYEHFTKQSSQGYDRVQQQDQPICRVCLQEGQYNNPLIAPCKCSGSAKFIHIKCIQEWFDKTINPRTINSAIIISWKPLVCELCAEALPFKIYFDGQKHFTVNIPRPKRPYLVLNPITSNQKGIKTKIYYLVSFAEKKQLKMGRKKQADIMIDEESTISRFHCSIQYLKNQSKPKFLISDNQSKFGTLVLLKKPIRLSQKLEGISFQFEGTVFTMSFRKGSESSKKQPLGDDGDDINLSQSSNSDESPAEEEG